MLFNEYKLLINSDKYANTNAKKMLVAKLYTCNILSLIIIYIII